MDYKSNGNGKRPGLYDVEKPRNKDLSFVHFDIKDQGRDSSAHSERQPRRSRHGGGGRRQLPFGWVVGIDVLIAALALGVFSLFYFILPQDLSGDAVKLPQPSSVVQTGQNPKPSASASQIASASPKESASQSVNAAGGAWRQKFADKFATGEVQQTDNSYKSANINVKIDKVQKDGVTYFVADIYVADIKYFKTAYASGKYQSAGGKPTDEIARANNAILAINGDNSPENKGPIIRNGELHDYKASMDVCVMNNDGSIETFSPDQFDIQKIKSQGAWQAWTFGPMLLKDGKPMEQFNSGVNTANPRTAIGYYEPGHYCFIVADGRQAGYSKGLSTQELSQVFAGLGCKAAFNLDGGQSTEMAFKGKLFNKPFNGGRSINDIVYIADQ